MELPLPLSPQKHTAIVLFYKYFVSSCEDVIGDDIDDENSCHNTGSTAVGSPVDVSTESDDPIRLLRRFPQFYVEQLQTFCKNLCTQLCLKGRILIAAEGINGTVSADSRETLERFIASLTTLDIGITFGQPDKSHGSRITPLVQSLTKPRLFDNIDWKLSTTSRNSSTMSLSESSTLQPFPDLKVSIVKEIISTGGLITVDDVKYHGGTHLSPQQFHQCLLDNPDVVLIDVRNTFEHAIGHFVHPTTDQPAMNPETVTFSSFDATFCASHAASLTDKKVLMYCTGGIRCEKASVMLKQRGVADVAQLSGGIHRYLETYGDTGLFRGKNFVFDQRVAQTPSECRMVELPVDPTTPAEESQSNHHTDHRSRLYSMATGTSNHIVGRCIECAVAFDELCGSRVCTVCRDLVLVCPLCQDAKLEYHCMRHQAFKACYFTFLEPFSIAELNEQATALDHLRSTFLPATQHRNVRRTLSRQLERIATRIQNLRVGNVTVPDRTTLLRRCRTCMETNDICDGRCWGFWKTSQLNEQRRRQLQNDTMGKLPVLATIAVGVIVEPGPDWNDLRLGSKFVTPTKPTFEPQLRRGTVHEVKTWGAGGVELDCVAVCWETAGMDRLPGSQRSDPLIYRWGVVALNGKRLYDLREAKPYL